MKKINIFLAKTIYSMFYWMDKKLNKIEGYDYETAPYCGHHFNGHNGYFTEGRYHEGDGGTYTKRFTWLFQAEYNTFDGWNLSLFPGIRKFFKNLYLYTKLFFKSFELDNSTGKRGFFLTFVLYRTYYVWYIDKETGRLTMCKTDTRSGKITQIKNKTKK